MRGKLTDEEIRAFSKNGEGPKWAPLTTKIKKDGKIITLGDLFIEDNGCTLKELAIEGYNLLKDWEKHIKIKNPNYSLEEEYGTFEEYSLVDINSSNYKDIELV